MDSLRRSAINDIRDEVREIRALLEKMAMAKRRKRTPEEDAEVEKRSREFRELLERRVEVDKKLAAERKQREAS